MTASPSLRPGTWIADPDQPTHALKPNADGSINVAGGGGIAIPVEPMPFGTSDAVEVASSATAVTVLAANSDRRSASVYYDGAATLYLLEGGGDPSTTKFTVKLGQGLFTLYQPSAGYTGAIRGIWSSAVGAAYVTEGQ